MTPSTCSAQKKVDRKREHTDESNIFKENIIKEGEHWWVQYFQGEHYQRNVLRIFVILSDPVGNPESSSVHRRSSNSINQSPNSKFLGLSLFVLVSTIHKYQRIVWAHVQSVINWSIFLGNSTTGWLELPPSDSAIWLFQLLFQRNELTNGSKWGSHYTTKTSMHTPKQVDDRVQKELVEKCVFVVCQCFWNAFVLR